jgi:hypothetical protein
MAREPKAALSDAPKITKAAASVVYWIWLPTSHWAMDIIVPLDDGIR